MRLIALTIGALLLGCGSTPVYAPADPATPMRPAYNAKLAADRYECRLEAQTMHASDWCQGLIMCSAMRSNFNKTVEMCMAARGWTEW